MNTDRADYSPGTTVTITGTGWVPGEAVTLTLAEVNNFDDPHPDRTLTAVADDAGNIVNTEFRTGAAPSRRSVFVDRDRQ